MNNNTHINRVFTTVVLDLAEEKFVNLTQTFFKKKEGEYLDVF